MANRLGDDVPDATDVRDFLHGRIHECVQRAEMASQDLGYRLTDVPDTEPEQ